ncbi:hypothetical protein FIBSPDRAFT_571249 [Athelia psychrophila]|uniref:Uncharacterized protein n=1 Tax=Athelia psychrophila TaxID=1759441 RepID=A0A166HT38_9AGAM|nr:hypothetical protein FIBSPDRAFT_571249 [Fibularhizoctonia sp. CBS 109695]
MERVKGARGNWLSSCRAGIAGWRAALRFVPDWKAGERDLVKFVSQLLYQMVERWADAVCSVSRVSPRSQLRTNASLHRRSSPVLITADVVRSLPSWVLFDVTPLIHPSLIIAFNSADMP